MWMHLRMLGIGKKIYDVLETADVCCEGRDLLCDEVSDILEFQLMVMQLTALSSLCGLKLFDFSLEGRHTISLMAYLSWRLC